MKQFSLIITLLAIAGAAIAHGQATGIVRERMDGMVVLKKSLKSLDAQVQSTASLDMAAIGVISDALMAHSGSNLTELFPNDPLPHTKALPDIWADWDDFSSLSNQLSLKAEELTKLTDKDEISTKLVEIRGICKDCHTFYRQNDK